MKFFVPHANTSEDAQRVYKSIVDFNSRGEGGWGQVSDQRIYRITFMHNGKPGEATVGEKFDPIGEEVIAILKSVTYLICTPNRGVLRDMPILVGENEIRSVEEFDP